MEKNSYDSNFNIISLFNNGKNKAEEVDVLDEELPLANEIAFKSTESIAVRVYTV